MRISDWSSDVCSSDLPSAWRPGARALTPRVAAASYLLAEPGHLVLELEDPPDPGEVEAVGEQLADAVEPLDVVLAVEARAAGAAGGLDQPAALVDAQVLDLHRDHVGRARDREHRSEEHTSA